MFDLQANFRGSLDHPDSPVPAPLQS